MVLVGDVGLKKLKTEAEKIEDDLLATGFISQVFLGGYSNLEISVEVTEAQLLRYGITLSEVARAIQVNNRDISGGTIKTKEEEILIRANAKEYDARGVADIVVRTNPDGSTIRVGDVASVREQFADTPRKTIYNQQEAVTIYVEKLITEDLVKITDFLRGYVNEYNDENDLVQIAVVNDQSEGLRERLELLINSGVTGLVLVLLVLGLFLNARLSFWVAWGIPFSFLGMFIIAFLVGITINMLSLFGMILAVGILVDDGIVVGENIYAHLEMGKSSVRAAIEGSMEVLPSVFTASHRPRQVASASSRTTFCIHSGVAMSGSWTCVSVTGESH